MTEPAAKTMKIEVGRCVHKCAVCGSLGTWDENWSWYGSLVDLEEGNQFEICSDACKDKCKAEGGPGKFGYRQLRLRGYKVYFEKPPRTNSEET
jgi:hypothetical protein